MNQLKNHIEEAFKLVSCISVQGDAVEVVAAARNHLRQAYQLAEAAEQPKSEA